MRRMANLVLMALCVVSVMAIAGRAQAQDKKAKMDSAKSARWHGIIIRSNKDDSTFTVRRQNVEKKVQYDSSTKWTSQEHGSKKVNDIDASQVADNDRVICLGTWDKKSGALHATLISKRLTP